MIKPDPSLEPDGFTHADGLLKSQLEIRGYRFQSQPPGQVQHYLVEYEAHEAAVHDIFVSLVLLAECKRGVQHLRVVECKREPEPKGILLAAGEAPSVIFELDIFHSTTN